MLQQQLRYLGIEMHCLAVGQLQLWRQLCYAPRIMLCYQLLAKLRLLTAGCRATMIIHLTKLNTKMTFEIIDSVIHSRSAVHIHPLRCSSTYLMTNLPNPNQFNVLTRNEFLNTSRKKVSFLKKKKQLACNCCLTKKLHQVSFAFPQTTQATTTRTGNEW